MPLTSTLSPSTRTGPVAAGLPMASANAGAASITATQATRLDAVAIVVTVGTMRRGSSGQRTTARLTPSSFMLSMASNATRATA